MADGVEYEYTLPDCSKRYEIVLERGDVITFRDMHKAVAFKPVKKSDDSDA